MKDVEYYYGKYAKRLLKPEHTAEAVNDILIERDAEIKTIPVEAGVIRILADAKDKLERLTQDLRQWLQYARYLRDCKKDEDKITPNQTGIEVSEKLIQQTYELMGKIRKIVDEPELPDD